MEITIRKFVESIIESEKNLQSAEHIIKVIVPIVKDNKLLLRSLETVNKSAISIISIILKYEHIQGNISISYDPKTNQEAFFAKCARKFGLNTDDIFILKRLLILGKKHKESGFEFSRKDKMVIMDDNLDTSELTKGDLESFIRIVRKLMLNARANFGKRN